MLARAEHCSWRRRCLCFCRTIVFGFGRIDQEPSKLRVVHGCVLRRWTSRAHCGNPSQAAAHRAIIMAGVSLYSSHRGESFQDPTSVTRNINSRRIVNTADMPTSTSLLIRPKAQFQPLSVQMLLITLSRGTQASFVCHFTACLVLSDGVSR